MKAYQPAGEIQGKRALKPTAVLSGMSTGSTPVEKKSNTLAEPVHGGPMEVKSSGLSTICMPVSMLLTLKASAGVGPVRHAEAPAPHRSNRRPLSGLAALVRSRSARLSSKAYSRARARSKARERPGYEPLQEVGEQAAPHHRREQIARQDGVGARLEVAAVGELVQARLGVVVGGERLRVRPANTAAPRLPPETELTANTCWAKFGHRSCMRARNFAVW